MKRSTGGKAPVARSANSNDPRALRSREAIVAALREEIRAGRPVTISSVSDAAAVSRVTFYNNFTGLEEAAWFAVAAELRGLLDRDVEERELGTPPPEVGVDSLRQVIDMLRDNHDLTRLANAYRDDSGLPGIAAVLLTIVREFRSLFGDPDAPHAEAENIYVASGLHGVFQVAVENGEDSASVARTAFALLPAWMREPRSGRTLADR
jgi:AcrR family transcriptional regulator